MSSPDLQDVRRDFSFSSCAAPLSDSCPKISEQGRREIRDRRIGERIGDDLGVELRGRVIEVRTYSIFELKYLHSMSKVFTLSIRINKEINRRINKQNP